MACVVCDPLGDLRAWQQRLERLSRHQSDAWAPPIDVYETGDAYVVTAELPGLTRDQVTLAIEKARLTIQGTREARPASGAAVHYHQVERGHGTFRRVFEFAEKIDGDRIAADLAQQYVLSYYPSADCGSARKKDPAVE